MAGKFGREFNLEDWRIRERSAKLNSANIFAYVIVMFGGWGFHEFEREHKNYGIQQRAPDIPYSM